MARGALAPRAFRRWPAQDAAWLAFVVQRLAAEDGELRGALAERADTIGNVP
jgi:hypothetical protein